MAGRKLFAAIDVGSHEIQMQIAEIRRGELPLTIETIHRTLPIGTDTYVRGQISQPVLDTCIDVLKGFSDQMKTFRVSGYRAVATSAFREASNRAFAIDQIRRSCDMEIEILSNAEERACHILAASLRMPDFEDLIRQGTLIVDIGAGSIQVTAYDRRQFLFSQNMLLGSLRIRELLADLEQRTIDFARLMEEYISSDLDYYHQLEPKDIQYKNLIVLGGGMPYLKKMAGRNPGEPLNLSVRQFDQIYQQLLLSRPLEMSMEKDIPAEHASLLLPTAIIIRKFTRYTGIHEFLMPATTLCDGILAEHAQKKLGYVPEHDQTQDVLSACRYLARRFNNDEPHTDFVETRVMQLFDGTVKLHRLGARQRLLLQAAAILHDAGKYINMSKHNIRTYNIIMATEFVGLTHHERDIVAWTGRLHSGRVDLDDGGLADLPLDDRMVVAKLAALLRLADALDNGHQQKISELVVLLDDGAMNLTITSRQDVTLELWAFEQKAQLFEKLFGYPVRIKIKRAAL